MLASAMLRAPNSPSFRSWFRSPLAPRAILALGFVSLLAACGGTADSTRESEQPDAAPRLDSLVDGHWRLQVDRVLKPNRPDDGQPTGPLSEADYDPTTTATTYDIVVSGEGADIVIGTTPFKGMRGAATSERATYDLQAGTFAGGRFVVWVGPRSLEAELTLYGSGVPVAKSERGDLTAVEP